MIELTFAPYDSTQRQTVSVATQLSAWFILHNAINHSDKRPGKSGAAEWLRAARLLDHADAITDATPVERRLTCTVCGTRPASETTPDIKVMLKPAGVVLTIEHGDWERWSELAEHYIETRMTESDARTVGAYRKWRHEFVRDLGAKAAAKPANTEA